MSRLLSSLRKMQDQDIDKWPSPFALQVLEKTLEKPALTELDSQTAGFVLDKPARPNKGVQGVGRAQVRREKRRIENSKAVEAYKHIHERAVALHQFDTTAAEQYRKLYVEIAQARRTRALQTFLITSALAGEGKSLSALNLAITSAASEDQQGVLLVDTDLRQPSIHQYLGLHPTCGLANYLLGEVESTHIFVETPIPGLTMIAAGSRVSNPTGLLVSPRMEQLFRDIKTQKQYSSIILDSSPVLLAAESKGLLQYADTAILVVHAQQTPREIVLQAIKTLGEENILGCLLNGVIASDLLYSNYYVSSDYHNVRKIQH
jgi:capsular exopolysaccharide synthesis family protein